MSQAVAGVGLDVVAVPRFAAALARTAGLRDRVFTPSELVTATGVARRAPSLAARFAAKEAAAKALGAPPGWTLRDCEVVPRPSGRPTLRLTGALAAAAAAQWIVDWHVSLSHDGAVAAAIVLAVGGFRADGFGVDGTFHQ